MDVLAKVASQALKLPLQYCNAFSTFRYRPAVASGFKGEKFDAKWLPYTGA
jgi:hypothetical protein